MLSVAPMAAQTWPQRTVKFVLPLGAGSGADIGARLIAEKEGAAARMATPGCTPDSIWINDGGFNAA